MADSSPTTVSAAAARPPASAASIAAAIAAAVAGEPALLHNIISFILFSSTNETEPRTPSPPAVVLRTIATLCRAFPALSSHVGPANEAFWRNMVLAHFDFTVGPYKFNVQDHLCEFYKDNGGGQDDECDDPEYKHWHRHPENGPKAEWARAYPAKPSPGDELNDYDWTTDPDYNTPGYYLVDSLHKWTSLKCYFNPKTYGFLSDIQQDRSRMAALWPDHEGAFSLFCDLLLLPRFQSTDKNDWETWSDGGQPVFPCLLGRFPTKIVGRGFAMLKFCGIAPHFWTRAELPVHPRWRGFDGPPPEVTCKWRMRKDQKKAEREARRVSGKREEKDEVEDDDDDDDDYDDDRDIDYSGAHSDCEERTGQECSIFPLVKSSKQHAFQHLRAFVYENFSDWRRVHISYDEYAGPEFYIGMTKRSGRWMGFVGESDYLSYGGWSSP